MTTLFGVDYSYSPPTPVQLAAGGVKFVVRYITATGPGTKGITKTEANALTAAGIAICLVWEQGADATLGGFTQGSKDATHAQANAELLGAPAHPIYFAIDFDATPAQQTAIDSYFEGVASVIGHNRTGVYGGYYPLARLHAKSLASFYWQTYAWSGGLILAYANLYQYSNGHTLGSGTVDFVRAFTPSYGQSKITPTKAKPKPVTTDRVYYRIQRGDTLASIAEAHKTTVAKLVELNHVRNPNLIYANERLRIK